MMRYNLGFKSIPNPEQYEWFIRTRPDLIINDFDINLETLDKTSVHSRLRKSIHTLHKYECSCHFCQKTNIDIMDDQFFIVHRNIATKAFSTTRGNKPITFDKIKDNWNEHLITYMNMSHGIPIKKLKLNSHIVR
uniref:Uncharacterized protein n=1 Tax=Pyramimonas orientalis virus TaxID=455367 RepID=A0A7L9AXZ8_POV01|nr:hypothetical protein HWQ62_00408 [Pyramimonas orientalis virus]